jgi:hypothetical protein
LKGLTIVSDGKTGASGGTRRRTVLLGAATGAGALALGAGAFVRPAEAASFVKGADISWMPQMETQGYYWNTRAGQRQDLFAILKGYGITAISLRTWVNPPKAWDLLLGARALFAVHRIWQHRLGFEYSPTYRRHGRLPQRLTGCEK